MHFWKIFIIIGNIFPNPINWIINFFIKKPKIKNSFYFSSNSEKFPLKVYSPNTKRKIPALILYPGATPLAENHIMLNEFAKVISYIGVRVFLPRIPDLKKVKINKRAINHMIDAYNSIEKRDDVDEKKIIGIGMSFAGSLWIRACINSKIKNRPAGVISYGSFFDFNDTVKFIMTGECFDGEKKYTLKPDLWGRIVFLYNFFDHYNYLGDIKKIKLFLKDKVLNEGKKSSIILKSLKLKDKIFIDKVFSNDKKFLLSISGEIMENIESKLNFISPNNFIDKIDFPISLIHGINDNMIPFTETIKFDKVLKEKKNKVNTFISSFHGHSTINNKSNNIFFKIKKIVEMSIYIKKIFKPIL